MARLLVHYQRPLRAGRQRSATHQLSLGHQLSTHRGAGSTLFSCLHNAGESAAVPGGRLELSLLDHKGNVIHSYTYTGDVSGAMMGVADKFIPQKTYGTFTLDAKLYQSDALVDQSSVTYDCEELDPTACPAESTDSTTIITILGGLAALVVLVGLAYIVNRMRAWHGKAV